MAERNESSNSDHLDKNEVIRKLNGWVHAKADNMPTLQELAQRAQKHREQAQKNQNQVSQFIELVFTENCTRFLNHLLKKTSIIDMVQSKPDQIFSPIIDLMNTRFKGQALPKGEMELSELRTIERSIFGKIREKFLFGTMPTQTVAEYEWANQIGLSPLDRATDSTEFKKYSWKEYQPHLSREHHN